jgi:hypothetical protein
MVKLLAAELSVPFRASRSEGETGLEEHNKPGSAAKNLTYFHFTNPSYNAAGARS